MYECVPSAWVPDLHGRTDGGFTYHRGPPRVAVGMSATSKLQRIVASAGELSRRCAQTAVVSGRVSLNGAVCKSPAMPVARTDAVALDGRALDVTPSTAEPRLWRYFKPPGLLTTHKDTHGRPTVFASLPSSLPRVVSVGRLDAASEGLLLLTDCGSLARQLMHPSSGVVREYHVCLATGERSVTPSMLERLERGITLNDGFTFAPMDVEMLPAIPTGAGEHGGLESGPGRQWLRMRLTEGKKHEVRRSWLEFGFATTRLVRTAYGPFRLEGLRPGDVDAVDRRDVEALTSSDG